MVRIFDLYFMISHINSLHRKIEITPKLIAAIPIPNIWLESKPVIKYIIGEIVYEITIHILV